MRGRCQLQQQLHFLYQVPGRGGKTVQPYISSVICDQQPDSEGYRDVSLQHQDVPWLIKKVIIFHFVILSVSGDRQLSEGSGQRLCSAPEAQGETALLRGSVPAWRRQLPSLRSPADWQQKTWAAVCSVETFFLCDVSEFFVEGNYGLCLYCGSKTGVVGCC